MRSASSELQKTVDELQATVAQLTQQLKEQAAQIQKVTPSLKQANLRRKWSTTISRAIDVTPLSANDASQLALFSGQKF